MSVRHLGPLNSGGAGYGAQSHSGPNAVYPDEETRLRPTATIAELIAEAHMPDQPADVLHNVATTRTQKTASSAAPQPTGVTFTYHAGPHLALEEVRLQLIPADEATDPAGEVHTMRRAQDGVFAVRLTMDASHVRKSYRWRVLADVSGGDVRGNPRALRDERVTFGANDPKFTVQAEGSTVRYSAVSYDRMGAVLQNDGRLAMRVHAPEALRVALKYWDEAGVAQRIPLQRDSQAAAQRSSALKTPPPRGLPPPPPSPGEERPTWTAQLSREASAALVNRPYLFEIDDKEVTDPFARALTSIQHGPELRRTAQVLGPAHTFANDAVPRERDARAWVTCRIDLSAAPHTEAAKQHAVPTRPASPLARLRAELSALASLGVTTVELDGLTPQNAAGARVQRNLAIDPSLGTPHELQALIDDAHGLGLNVVLGTQYDASAADRPADADFVRNHAVYQLDAFHADGLRVAVSRGDAPGDDLQVAEMTRQLGCLRTHLLTDDAGAPSNLARAALETANRGRADLAALQDALGARRSAQADSVGPPALPVTRAPMTLGQARMAVALGLLTASDAGLFDAYDLGGFTWSPRQNGLADQAVRAHTRDIPLDDLRFTQALRQKFEHLLTLTQQARQADPLYKGLGLGEQLMLALLAALTPQASRRLMDDLTRRHMDRFAQDMVRLRKRWPSLFDAVAETEVLRAHTDTGVSITAHGKRFVVVAHTGDEAHDGYNVPLPPGRWQRIIHSESKRYGGSEPNAEATPSVRGGLPRPMRLVPHSVQIFECVDS